ncbi:MAG TPA: DUF4214 domain-containing protein, partial [Pirellulales bacterium]|nr:DUF4214 domain-containing protein [Pirellulales bacterium]
MVRFTDDDPAGVPTDYTATIDWGDQTAPTTVSGSRITAAAGTFGVPGSHDYALPGTYTVTITIRDADATVTVNATAAVATASLIATALPVSATEGSTFNGAVATFTDADGNTNTSAYSAKIVWGDGNTSTGTISAPDSKGVFTVSGTDTYAEEREYTLSVAISDTNGNTATVDPVATVADPSVSATAVAISATEGASATVNVATFTDPGGAETISNYSATINWGDGTTAAAGSVTLNNGVFTVNGSHTFAEAGTLEVSVTITQGAPATSSTSVTSTASVSLADTLTATNMTVATTASTTFTGAVAGFTDSNTSAVAGDFTAAITWGDGTSTTGTVTGSRGAFTVTGLHAYSTAGSDTVKVTITEVNISSTSATATSTADVVAATITGATTGTISGLVFDDLTLSGVFQSGDTGLAGRTVFLNTDVSGTADGTNPQTTTDANGSFTFTGLAAGSYQVMETILPDSGQALTTSVQTVTLTSGQTVTGVNIGNSITSTIVPVQVALSIPPATNDANATYVNALYQTILGHAPDAAGLAFWGQQLSAGVSHTSVVQGIWNAAEHRKEEVDEFYREFLNRAADSQGEQFWITAFDNWGTEQLEVVGFLTSTPEYANLHSGNTAFVDALYHSVDQRPADSAGENNWVSQLGNGAAPVQV